MLRGLMNCVVACMIVCVCQGCWGSGGEGDNSIYYWRTTFSLSDAEREFLRKHGVSKIYLHYFDVDGDYSYLSATPEATIKFQDSVPEGIEIVPTVYITVNAMRAMQLCEEEYAEKILKRVNAISKRNNIEFREVQLDCDWTKSTRQYFFRLCEAMKDCMDSTQILSSTIRLHQLVQDPPPVDKGVLMVYNTGNLMDVSTVNSIFSKKDIEPYLSDDRLSDFQLPLDVAYPVYGWGVIYNRRGDDYYFGKIVPDTDPSKYPELKRVGYNMFEATCDTDSIDSYVLDRGDRVRAERPRGDEILEIKKLIDKKLNDKPHSNILYHLDENQISHYNDHEISKIYTRN